MEKNRILIDTEGLEEELIELPQNKFKFVKYIILIFILLLFILIGFASYYYFRKQKEKSTTQTEISSEKFASIKEKYYYPREDLTANLQNGIQIYREGFLSKAEKHFQKILDTSLDNLEKAIASTYIGIINLDEEKYLMAKYYFTRALEFQDNYLPALVNLSFTEYHLGNLQNALDIAERAKKIAPDDPLVSILAGNILMNIKGASEAEKEFRRGVELGPEEPISRYNLAVSLLRQGKDQEALIEFQHFLELFPTNKLTPNVLALIGQIYYQNEQFENALSYYKRAIGFAPDNAKFYYNMGVIYYRLDDLSKAREYFEKAINLGKTDPDIYEKLSYIFEELDSKDLALKALEKSLQSNPDHLPTLFRLADVYYNKRDLLNSAEVYRKIINRTPGTDETIQAYIQLGKIYIEMERYEDAVIVLKKAMEISVNPRIEIFYELGRAYYYGGRKDKAIEVWKNALEKNYITPDEESKIRMILSKSYQNLGSSDLALKEIEKIDVNDKNFVEVNFQKGDVYKNLKDYDTAISYYNKVFESPNSNINQKVKAAVLIADSYINTNNIQNLEAAKSWLNKAIRLDPDNPEILITKAKIHLLIGSPREVEKAIEVLLPLSYQDHTPPVLKEIYLQLGIAFYKNKEYQRALQSIQMVLEIDPSNDIAIKYKNQILQIWGR